MRFVDELGFAFGWIAPKPVFQQRTAHAVAAGGRVWVIDPVDDDEALQRVAQLGDPAGVVQLLDRHGRDCSLVAQRLGVPHHVVPEVAPPAAPFEVVPVLRRGFWRESALWFPEHRTLVCADVLGTVPYFRASSERIGVSPLLRFTPPRALLRYEPEHVLVGHGEGVHENAAQAVREAVLEARRRTPSWFVAAARSMVRR
jgi:hypothetical protein